MNKHCRLTPECIVYIHNTFQQKGFWDTGVYLGCRRPNSFKITHVVKLRKFSGCRQMPAISETTLAKAYVRLAKRNYIPCAIIRVNLEDYIDGVFGDGVGTGLWDTPLGMDFFSISPGRNKKFLEVAHVWSTNRWKANGFMFGTQCSKIKHYKKRIRKGLVTLIKQP
jgi:hypothetical protein